MCALHAACHRLVLVQSKLLVDQEIHQTTLATLKKAVTDQEAVITRLQQVGVGMYADSVQMSTPACSDPSSW